MGSYYSDGATKLLQRCVSLLKDAFRYYLNISLVFPGLVLLTFLFISIHAYAEVNEHKNFEMINITAGQVGILDDEGRTQRYGVEYRFKSFSGPYGFRLIPAIGLAASNEGARFFMGT